VEDCAVLFPSFEWIEWRHLEHLDCVVRQELVSSEMDF
jgi:hypothetical protein